MQNKIIILTFLLFILILPSFVLGVVENFQISGAKEVAVYECGTSEDGIITVTNTGEISSGYRIDVGGSAASFIAMGPVNFVLEPGESQDILTYFTVPCNSEGEYDLYIHVHTVLDLGKVIQQEIIVEKPKNIEITPIKYIDQIKPCNTAFYSFNIKNIGFIEETYSLEFDKSFGKYTGVNFNEVTLSPNQEALVDFYITPSCNIYGNYTVSFSVKTSKTELNAKSFVYLVIDRDYDYSLQFGSAYPYVDASAVFSEHNEAELYTLCTNSKEIIPVKLKNNENFINTYDISIKAPEWIKLTGNKVELNNTQEGITGLLVDTYDIEGDFQISVDVKSELGDIKQTKNIILSVENCYEPSIFTANDLVLDYNPVKIPLNIQNKGLRTANYEITLENADWLSLESSSIVVNPGETKVVNIVSTPNEATKRGNYKADLLFKVKDTGVVYEDSLKATLVTMNIFDQIYYNVLKPYLWYILAALILLILLLLLLILVIKKQKSKPKKIIPKKVSIKKKSEKKTFKNKKFWFFLLLALLLLLIMALILYLFRDKLSGVYSILKTILLKIKDFIFAYWLYFVIGLGILLLLIILLLVIKRLIKKGVFKKKEKIKEKKISVAKKTIKKINWKKLKPSKKTLKILLIILAILILIGLGFLIYYFWPGEAISNVWDNRTIFIKKNVTEIVPEDNITKINLSEKIKPFFINIKDFFVKYINYILYTIIGLVILALLILLLLFLLKRWKKNRIMQFEAGSVDKEIVLKSDKMSFGEVILKLKRPAYSVGLLLQKIRKPTFIKPEGIVYEYASLEKENIDNSNIDNILVRFKVKKSWLKRHHIKRVDVSLKRYHNHWFGVNTKNISEDKKYYYYESILNQVGILAIVGKVTPIIKEKKVFLAKKPRKKIDKKKLKKFFWFVISFLLLILLAGAIFFFWALIIAFILLYMWFILGAIGLLILLALLTWLIVWLKKKKFKLKHKTKKRLLGLLSLILLIIAIILLLMYLRPVFVGLANENRTITVIEEVEVCSFDENASELTEEDLEACETLIETKYISKRLGDNILFKDEFIEVEMLEDGRVETGEMIAPKLEIIPNEPSVIISPTKGIPDQEWNEDTNLTIELSKYFSDPDRDSLYYTNTELQNINVYYVDGDAILVPKKNWHGSEFVIFTAKDMKGGEVDSNLVKLAVLDVAEENFFVKIWEWLK